MMALKSWTRCTRRQWGAHEGGPSSYDLCPDCGHNNYWHGTVGCNHPDCLKKEDKKGDSPKYINPYSKLGVGKKLGY